MVAPITKKVLVTKRVNNVWWNAETEKAGDKWNLQKDYNRKINAILKFVSKQSKSSYADNERHKEKREAIIIISFLDQGSIMEQYKTHLVIVWKVAITKIKKESTLKRQ